MGDDEELWETAEPIPARKLDFLIVGVDLIRRTTGVIEEALANLEQILVMHANYLSERQSFADQARLAIENLTKEE